MPRVEAPLPIGAARYRWRSAPEPTGRPRRSSLSSIRRPAFGPEAPGSIRRRRHPGSHRPPGLWAGQRRVLVPFTARSSRCAGECRGRPAGRQGRLLPFGGLPQSVTRVLTRSRCAEDRGRTLGRRSRQGYRLRRPARPHRRGNAPTTLGYRHRTAPLRHLSGTPWTQDVGATHTEAGEHEGTPRHHLEPAPSLGRRENPRSADGRTDTGGASRVWVTPRHRPQPVCRARGGGGAPSAPAA